MFVAVDEKVHTLFEDQVLESVRTVRPRPEPLLGRLGVAVGVAAAVPWRGEERGERREERGEERGEERDGV